MTDTYTKVRYDKEITVDKKYYKNYEENYKKAILAEIERERKEHE